MFGGKKAASKTGTKPITPAPAVVAPPTIALPATTTKPMATPANADSAVVEAVESWAAAWSSQNVQNYLSHYAKSFKTPKGESRKDWEEMRKERVTRPASISVKIAQPQSELYQ